MEMLKERTHPCEDTDSPVFDAAGRESRNQEARQKDGARTQEIGPHRTDDASAGLSGLSAEDLPLSPIFVDFIARKCDGMGFDGQVWPNQLSEELSAENVDMARCAEYRLRLLVSSPQAQRAITRTYEWFRELITGRVDALRELHRQYQFVAIIGIPRSGGSYLTAEFYKSLGFNPEAVPAALAHDGVPEARPVNAGGFGNTWVQIVLRMAEFLTMLETEYEGRKGDRPILIPKKIVKGIYAPGFFRIVLGPSTEYVVTVRHPIASCISTIEKSGGMPASGKFAVRSAIERWIVRDIMLTGVVRTELRSCDYFDAYVRYWEQFYMNLALSGLLAHRRCTIVPYGRHSMEDVARAFHARVGSTASVSAFVAHENHGERHAAWAERSELALQRVSAVWQTVGLRFPVGEVAACS
jgi:hypothetical protein